MAVLSGGEALEARLRELAGKVSDPATLRVGFLEGATYPDGTSVATVVAAQNFGAPSKGIPPRPFFTTMIARNAPGWGDKLARVLLSVDYDAPRALALMGAGIAGQLRQAIVDTTAPDLSPVTLLLRDRFRGNPEEITFADVQQARRDIAAGVQPESSGTGAKPLVWTGHLLNSVDSEVAA